MIGDEGAFQVPKFQNDRLTKVARLRQDPIDAVVKDEVT